MDPLESRLRRNRDVAGRFLMVGIVLLLIFGFGYGFSQYLSVGGGGALVSSFSLTLAGGLLGAILAFCALSTAAWMYWGWRLGRTSDPWAYDRELDGPDPGRPGFGGPLEGDEGAPPGAPNRPRP